jgi:hypothetical protein
MAKLESTIGALHCYACQARWRAWGCSLNPTSSIRCCNSGVIRIRPVGGGRDVQMDDLHVHIFCTHSRCGGDRGTKCPASFLEHSCGGGGASGWTHTAAAAPPPPAPPPAPLLRTFHSNAGHTRSEGAKRATTYYYNPYAAAVKQDTAIQCSHCSCGRVGKRLCASSTWGACSRRVQ